MPSMNQRILERVELMLPPLPEQQRIAAVLGGLDDLIDTNQRLVRNLWDACHAAFAASVEGAETKALNDVMDLKYGKALPARGRRSGEVLVVSSAGVVDRHDEPLVRGPGVVVGRKGTVGSVTWVPTDFFPIDTAFYVTGDLPHLYSYFLLQGIGLQDLNTDSAVPGLNRSNALAQTAPVAGPAALARFNDLTDPLLMTISELEHETATLTRTRGELLPLLMSGAVTPGDVTVAS